MAKFKIGDRARFVKSNRGHNTLVGKTVRITEIGPFKCSGTKTTYSYSIEFEDGTTPKDLHLEGSTFIANDDQLEPIIPLGSWDELERTINWNPTKRKSITGTYPPAITPSKRKIQPQLGPPKPTTKYLQRPVIFHGSNRLRRRINGFHFPV